MSSSSKRKLNSGPLDKSFAKRKKPKNKLIFCGICMESKENPDMFTGLSICNHLFCVDCIAKYVGSKIKEKIGNIECPYPNCNRAIEPENCVSILPNKVFVRWETALCEASILGCQKFYCPFKDCSGLMVDDGEEEVRQSVCPHCSRMFCARCRVRWHEGVRCEEFEKLDRNEREREDIMLKKLAKDKKWRRCTNCRIYVEKKGGCLHITCRCRYEFCYKCGCKWSSSHAC